MPEEPTPNPTPKSPDHGRRGLLKALALVGFSGPAAAALAEAGAGAIGSEQVAAAERLAGLELTAAERELMLAGLEGFTESYRAIRGVELPNSVPPALVFKPEQPGMARPRPVAAGPAEPPTAAPPPGDEEAIAFASIRELGQLLRTGRLSSRELTELYLDRLDRFSPLLHCTVTSTRERALAQADRADRALAAGHDRGPLHGIPWGAKDLLAVAGYPTTWGATPFRGQQFDLDAAVVQRLDAAGAVLVAKLSLGALAWGDVWFGGMTRNPWNLEQGASGSSAGSASATAAGLVGFSIGSETWGSIVSPSTRCGTTGLRPTFGRVSRHGAMALSWSMDKLGPICRTAHDCALVFAAIHGPCPGERDGTVEAHPFVWPAAVELAALKVGVPWSLFDEKPAEETPEEAREREEWQGFDRAALAVLENLGVQLVPMELPKLPVAALSFLLSAEAAAAFDELTRSNRDDELERQVAQAWPNVFRQARFIPAVEYIQANRVRSLLIADLETKLAGLDLYVAPSFGGDNLLLNNLTGHPCVVLPNGFRQDGTPTSISFVGRLFGEERLLAVARAYQEATDFHTRRPPLGAPATP